MKIFTILLILVCPIASTGFFVGCDVQMSQDLTPPESGQSIEDYLASQNFIGSILVEKSGNILISKGFGYADFETKEKNTAYTKFRIGSITKLFTSLGILILEEEGLLSIEHPISRYLEGFPNGGNITVKHLLTHTSGIRDYTSPLRKKANEEISSDQLVMWIAKLRPEFKPGKRFSYSNSNYVLLGRIIEVISGQSYADYLHRRILRPSNMAETGYGSSILGTEGNAIGYENDYSRIKGPKMSFAFSSGALSSTVADMQRFHNIFKNLTLLSASSIEKLYQVQIDNISLGWIVESKFYDRRAYWHGGKISGFQSVFVRFPDNDAMIVILSNSQGSDVITLSNYVAGMVLNP